MSKQGGGVKVSRMKRMVVLLVLSAAVSASCSLAWSNPGNPAKPDVGALPKSSSISGKVSLSEEIKAGFVLALTTKERKAAGGGSIGADGTYRIDQLAAGTYDLAFIAHGHERQIGLGYLPSPDTLKPEERQAIRNLYARLDKAIAQKSINAVMSCYSKNYKASAPAMTAQELREFWSTVFPNSISVANVRNIHIIAGKTGESAVVVSHSELTMNLKPNPRLKDQKTMERVQDNATRLVLENGVWRIVGSASPPDACLNCDGPPAFMFYPIEGEPAKVKWRYTNDPAIAGIKLSAGMESKGHDIVLAPLK